MSWATPVNVPTGTIYTQAWSDLVRDDLAFLKDRVDNPPRAYLQHSAAQSAADGTPLRLAFNSEPIDSGGLHDNVTNNSRITIPTGETGWWAFKGYVEFASNSTGQRKLALYLNGALLVEVSQDATAGGNATRMIIGWDYPASVGDYFELFATQNSGGALNIASNAYFTARRAT